MPVINHYGILFFLLEYLETWRMTMCSLYKVQQSGVMIQSRGGIRSTTSYFDLILGSEWLEFQPLRNQF